MKNCKDCHEISCGAQGSDNISMTCYDCIYELPRGWDKLFSQMCEDIRQPLIDTNCFDKFKFIQVKEKYGSLRVYTDNAPKEVCDIISKYEYISQFVCCECGKPAIYQTSGYICPYCNDCWKDKVRHKAGEFIEFNPILKFTTFGPEGSYTTKVDCSDIWEKLYSK